MNWTEKYRPDTIADMVGLADLKRDAEGWKENGYPSALLFSGPPGTGKTTAARAIAMEMLGEWYEPGTNFVVTNASDDRGIDFVRSELKQMARAKAIGTERKVILLDEADGLTPAAQDALRQVMETTSKSTLFILTANYPEKLKPAIKSRCRHYKFGPVNPEDGMAHLAMILMTEVHPGPVPPFSQQCLEGLVGVCNGDLRQAITILESLPDYDEGTIMQAVRSQESGLDEAALAYAEGDYSIVAVRINGALERGDNRYGILKGLQRRLRNLIEDEEYYRFMRVWGRFMQYSIEWPADDRAFFDYFLAELGVE